MLWYFLFTGFQQLVLTVFSLLHLSIVSELPFGVDEFITNGVAYFRSLWTLMPWFGHLFAAVLVYLTFRLTLFTLEQLRIIKVH